MKGNEKPDFSFELAFMAEGTGPVCGVDEAGRGPLAGPVVAAAVILSPTAIPDGLNDSKAMSAKVRLAVFEAILATASVGIAAAPPARIDAMNIRGATLWAMAEAICALPVQPQHALIDGRDCPPAAPCSCQALIGGDRRSQSIAAASIVAKVWRDRIMAGLDRSYPVYGFARHKGYPTADHRLALIRHGPSPHHRMSFAPVQAAALVAG